MSAIGISCWRGVEARECDASIEIDSSEGYDALHDKAGAEGWVIGHYNGQAHYACAHCAETVWDPHVLHGFGDIKAVPK